MENAINRMAIAANIMAEYYTETAAQLRTLREAHERTHCIECGRQITDWDTTEQTDNELILTYTCPCGCIAEQHYQLTYTGTTICQEGTHHAE